VAGILIIMTEESTTPVKRSVLWASFFDQKRSLEKLIEESRADGDFYFFLSISAFITTLGLLFDNVVIVIGGMLVAPLLYPILALSMGITTSNGDSIKRSFKTIGQSAIYVFLVTLITSVFFRGEVITQDLLLSPPPVSIFFLVALAAGLGAAFSWVKQDLSSLLPGVAVSVALIPPLSAVGIGVVHNDFMLSLNALTIFLVNLFGIGFSALVIFSLFGFSRLQNVEEKLIVNETVDTLVRQKAKLQKSKGQIKEVERKLEEVKEKVKENELRNQE